VFAAEAEWLIRHHIVYGVVTHDNTAAFMKSAIAVRDHAKALGDGFEPNAWQSALDKVTHGETTALTSSSKLPSGGPTASSEQLESAFSGCATGFAPLFHGILSDTPSQCRDPVCGQRK
jgi:hypothetical protein